MKPFHSYILVLDYHSSDLQVLTPVLESLWCPFVITQSAEQALERIVQSPPCLVILIGHDYHWSSSLINTLRKTARTARVTIVALTDVHAPNWLRQEENPGLDGFLVKPLSREVATSVVQSAWARQTYCPA